VNIIKMAPKANKGKGKKGYEVLGKGKGKDRGKAVAKAVAKVKAQAKAKPKARQRPAAAPVVPPAAAPVVPPADRLAGLDNVMLPPWSRMHPPPLAVQEEFDIWKAWRAGGRVGPPPPGSHYYDYIAAGIESF
jgi:hypothetical protein